MEFTNLATSYVPSSHIELASPANTVAGAILFYAQAGPDNLRLIFRLHEEQHHLHLGDGSLNRAFHTSPPLRSQRPALILRDWRLELDLASAYTGLDDTPEEGDAFFGETGLGIVGRMNHATCYVPLNGTMLTSEPEWASNFVGYRNWRLVIDLPHGDRKLVFATHSRSKPEAE